MAAKAEKIELKRKQTEEAAAVKSEKIPAVAAARELKRKRNEEEDATRDERLKKIDLVKFLPIFLRHLHSMLETHYFQI